MQSIEQHASDIQPGCQVTSFAIRSALGAESFFASGTNWKGASLDTLSLFLSVVLLPVLETDLCKFVYYMAGDSGIAS